MLDQITIRRMALLDLASVMDVERQNIGTPCSTADLIERLNQRNTSAIVAEDEAGSIVGYAVYDLNKDAIYVSGFCVAEFYRRRGVGSAMARYLMTRREIQKRESIVVEVSESNLAGQMFLSHFGFRAEVIYRGVDGGEDVYQFRYRAGANIPANRISAACRAIWPE